jgi:hypothetical protein
MSRPQSQLGTPTELLSLQASALPSFFRYEATENGSALAEAISALREAVQTAPPAHYDRPIWHGNLANALLRHYDHTTMIESLEEAVEMRRIAVQLNPGHAQRALHLGNLATTLMTHYSATRNRASLNEAVSVMREANHLTVPGDPSRPMRLSNFARMLYATGDPTSIMQAADLFAEAVRTVPEGHRAQADCLNGLAMCRHTIGGPAGRLEALRLFRRACRTVTSPAATRARIALDWIRLAEQTGDHEGHFEALTTAVGLLDTVAWRGITRADQERQLRRFAGVASDAAALAIAAGRPEFAVELLEQGRAVLLAQALDTRTSLESLALRAPELAERLVVIDEELEGSDDELTMSGAEQTFAQDQRTDADRRMHLAKEREELLNQVRVLPGLDNFLLAPRFEVLRIAAAKGPIVMVNTSRHGCHGLTVTLAGVHVTPLPSLSNTHISTRVLEFLAAITAIGNSNHETLSARQTITDTLEWLWISIAEPILSDLNITRRYESMHEQPRIWWCPSGLLSFLPLHAAGHHTTRTDDQPATVLDRVISSYTPTLRMLLPARNSSAAEGHAPVLVAMPVTPGQPNLPAAAREIDALRRLFPTVQVLRVATRPETR